MMLDTAGQFVPICVCSNVLLFVWDLFCQWPVCVSKLFHFYCIFLASRMLLNKERERNVCLFAESAPELFFLYPNKRDWIKLKQE